MSRHHSRKKPPSQQVGWKHLPVEYAVADKDSADISLIVVAVGFVTLALGVVALLLP